MEQPLVLVAASGGDAALRPHVPRPAREEGHVPALVDNLSPDECHPDGNLPQPRSTSIALWL
ncbi:MAG: hypothetical protein ISS49_03515 [Anaerolineae bacterium]|nr:hypothetical protein [Anaerolineae bacterium]